MTDKGTRRPGGPPQARLFVDTNVFLRFLTWDDPEKAERAEALFVRAVEGRAELETSLLVIAEIVWTLESYYQLEKPDIAGKVEKILNTPNLHCPDSEMLLQALDLYATKNIDFIDAFHAFLLKRQGRPRIVTYDRKHFGRVEWLEVMEP